MLLFDHTDGAALEDRPVAARLRHTRDAADVFWFQEGQAALYQGRTGWQVV